MNTNQNVTNMQGPMQAAIHAANISAKEKADKDDTPMPAIVARQDLLGNKIIFLADTQTKEGKITYWDGKKGSKPSTAPIEFYKSTKPLATKEEVIKMVQDFSKEFGVKNVEIRQRLIKGSVLHRDAEGNVEDKELDSYKERLIAAIAKTIREVK